MPNPDCFPPLHPAAAHGLALFNARKYFEAHEELENAWRDEPGPIRELYQGILQVAVTYLHIQRGNYAGAVKVAARCQTRLAAWPDCCRGVHVAALRQNLADVLAALNRLGPERIDLFDQALFKPIIFQS